MRHVELIVLGGSSNAVVDQYGSGRHGCTDGDPITFQASKGINGNATKIGQRWFTDTMLNLKNACIEGNGVLGPSGNDANDDPFELVKAVNSAGSVLTGSSNFVASGLRFTTGGGSLDVTLAAGVICYGGRKYHVTAEQLADADFSGAAGMADSFTLTANKDSYISIVPLLDNDVTIVGDGGTMRARFELEVTAVNNGDPVPAVPSGFFFAMLVTDGSGVTAAHYPASQKIGTQDYGWEFVSAYVNYPEAIIPVLAGSNIGALTAPDDYGDVNKTGGRFIGTVFAQRSHWRQHNAPGRRADRAIDGETATSTTAGAASSNLIIFDMGVLPNNSLIEFQVEVIGFSDASQGFTTTIRRMCLVTSGGGKSLYGSTRVVSVDDPNAIGCTADYSQSGDFIRVTVTGAVGHNIQWMINVRTIQLRG